MVPFKRPEHRAVAAALRAMDHDLLTCCACWFGSGTEIVLGLGEYRLSKDIDFLCSDANGYREMRSLVLSHGTSALFSGGVREERVFKSDQYGIRGIISLSRISRSGSRSCGRAALPLKDNRTGRCGFLDWSSLIESLKRCSRTLIAARTDRQRTGMQ